MMSSRAATTAVSKAQQQVAQNQEQQAQQKEGADADEIAASVRERDEKWLIAALPEEGSAPAPSIKQVQEPVIPASAEMRDFSDSTGAFKIRAEVADYKQGWVQQKREDGKVITVQVSKLSEADQRWLKENFGSR